MSKTLKSFAELKAVEKELKIMETKPANIIKLKFSVTHLNANRIGLRVAIPNEYIASISNDGKTCPPFYVPHSKQANLLFCDLKAFKGERRTIVNTASGIGVARFSCDDYEAHVGLFGVCEGELDLNTGYVTLPEHRPPYRPRKVLPRGTLSEVQLAAPNIDPAERLRFLRDEINSILEENSGRFLVEIEDGAVKILRRRVIEESL